MKQQLLEAGYNEYLEDYLYTKQLGPLFLKWYSHLNHIEILEITSEGNILLCELTWTELEKPIEQWENAILEMYKVLKGLNNETE